MTRHHRVLLGLALAAPLLLAACAQTPGREPPTLEERLERRGLQIGEEVDRVPMFRTWGWNDVDREHVILHSGARRQYLITLMTPCLDLDMAHRIGVKTTMSNTLTRFDSIVVGDSLGSGAPRTCPIRQIHELVRVEDGEDEEEDEDEAEVD